jgi:5-methylcytosine-specific restriction enzyme A
MNTEFYIYKKEIDWSVLHEGFSIPVSIQINFQNQLKRFLKRGESKQIKILLDNKIFNVKLINQPFDGNKYPCHTDIIQIRYSPNSDLSQLLRIIFKKSYDYIKAKRIVIGNKRTIIKVPNKLKEFIVIYATSIDDTLQFDCLTSYDSKEIKSYFSQSGIKEQDFELAINYNLRDFTAKIEKRYSLIKLRKLDKAIGDNLKLLYQYNCQICGMNFAEIYKGYIVETHHIEPFIISLNNDANNILIICPNHHRLIHNLNPVFDKKIFTFSYPNGYNEKLLLNKHLVV